MARDLELLKLRDKRILEVYDRMRKKRRGGAAVHTVEYIIWYISTEVAFVSKRTIERVIYGDK